MDIPIRVSRDFGKTYPDASASATECAMNLARTGDLVLGRVSLTLQPLEVSPAGGLVLGILKDAGQPCPPNYISERLIVSRATVTGVLDTLVKRGLRASGASSHGPTDGAGAPHEGRLSHGRQSSPYGTSRRGGMDGHVERA